MPWKDALIRAIRTAAQTLAGTLVALPIADSLDDLQTVGPTWLLALIASAMSGLVSFLQNVAVDQPLNIPKG
jgi:hypothetical protein